MNIYLLCKRYYTNKDLINDRFGRLYHLPMQLAQQGNKVLVDAFDYRNRISTSIQDNGVLFRTIPATSTKIPGFLWHAYRNIYKANPDILIASGDIYIGYVGLNIARRLGIRFVFDVYDYYPVFRINRFPGLTSLFNHTVKNADLVMCASKPLLQAVLAGLNENALLIENGVDRTAFTTGDSVQARQTLKLPADIPLVGYFGSIIPTRGPLLIEACRKIREKTPTLRLVLAGRLTDICINESWIDYFGELPQSSIPTLIQACDVVCLPYADDTFNCMSGACKIAEYLACGKPVVATNVSNHAQIFKDAPSSLCDPTVEDMARAIESQLKHPEIAPYPNDLDWQSIGRKLHKELTKLVR
ncbi:glycosyltransferase family 4 protein [Methylomonas montana]|uniref:glycosyltransferase family 4 protein n=1 Tax=Methylomonas montana TaxID=3058963 RepID=UPI00265823E1|nr:glycosyltransferase family 4 protein [Methylomonas montana]WKJ88636.1 glycosyltransferase family 4 protein [Methylomonas montana]